jgi:hypothetical protein
VVDEPWASDSFVGMTRSVRFTLATLVGLLLLACTAAAAPARGFWVEAPFAGIWLSESPWALSNHVDALNCEGIGKAKRDAAYQNTYTSFRCEVHAEEDGASVGEVLVKPAGPEFMRVARWLSGGPLPEPNIGPIPKGRGPLRSSDVPPLLESSRWAKNHEFAAARCFGIGPFEETKGVNVAGFYFTAFVCRTTVVEGEDHVLLVTSTGGRAVRVVRVLV